MDSWPLSVQWAVLTVLAAAFIVGSCGLTLSRARANGTEPATWRGKLRMFVKDLGFSDWAFIALLAAFFIPLTIETVMGT